MRSFAAVVLVLFCGSQTVLGIDVIGGFLTIQEGEHYETVNYGASPSRGGWVYVTGGSVDHMNGYGTGEANMGGYPWAPSQVGIATLRDLSSFKMHHSSQIADTIQAYDNSFVLIYDGSVTSLIQGFDDSHVRINGGYVESINTYNLADVYDGTVGLVATYADPSRGPGTARIMGGNVNTVFCMGVLEVSGGSVGWVDLWHGGEATVSAGTLNAVTLADDSQLTITGGDMSGTAHLRNESSIIVQGQGFNYPYGVISETAGTLTGLLADGGVLNLSFERHDPNTSIILVPEPVSLFLLALGGAGAMARRRKNG